MRGIVGYGAYVPYYRLQRSAITAALGAGGGRGNRAVAAYDEDENFPAFIVVDDKGNDFYKEVTTPVALRT